MAPFAPLLPALLLLAPAPALPAQYVIEAPSGGSLLPGLGLVPTPFGIANPPAVAEPPGLAVPAGPPVLPSAGVAGSTLPPPGGLLPYAVVPTPQLAWGRPR